MTETNLKPCPFCYEDRDLEINPISRQINKVNCGGCGACGPAGYTDEEAIERWNKRA